MADYKRNISCLNGELFSIRQASEKLGVPATTLRHWEKVLQGVWKPSRTKGGQRRYSAKDMDVLLKVKHLSENMSLAAVRETLLKDGDQEEKGVFFDWTDKLVLVTGGTGSFGKAFVRYLLKEHHPRAVRVYSRDELKQYQMQKEFDDSRLRFLIGDVRDRKRLIKAARKVDVIIHAAAMKHVPICEYNPFEAVKTNVWGTQNVIDAALENEVSNVIILSTDKAVNPVNLYGATKLCAEKVFVHANVYSGDRPTRFACVRYGNVIGSRGSVIPLFLEQMKNGYVTVTDPRMTRFWLTLSEAVRLVVRALSMMNGGEIFVPRIPSMKITDLAKAIAPGCRQKIIGIRPGEKLHELLISECEGWYTDELDDLYVIHANHKTWRPRNISLKGRPVPEGFYYSSNKNDKWLNSNDLRELLIKEGFLK